MPTATLVCIRQGACADPALSVSLTFPAVGRLHLMQPSASEEAPVHLVCLPCTDYLNLQQAISTTTDKRGSKIHKGTRPPVNLCQQRGKSPRNRDSSIPVAPLPAASKLKLPKHATGKRTTSACSQVALWLRLRPLLVCRSRL